MIFDERLNLRSEIGGTALVKVGEHLLLASFKQASRNPGLAQVQALVVQLAAHHAEQGRLYIEIGQRKRTPVCRHESNNLPGHAGVHQSPRLADYQQCCLAIHTPQPQAIQRHGGHAGAKGLQLGQEVLANAQQNLVVMPPEGEGACLLGMLVYPRLQRGGRAAFGQVGQLIDEGFGGFGAVRIDAAEREDLLELIQHQKGHHRTISRIPEVVAVPMEVLPKSLADAG